MQDNPQLKAVLKAKLSQAEDSGHSSSSNGGPPPEGPSAEERAARQRRAREECSEPPAPIRVDVLDSGSSTQLFFSANPVTYEVRASLEDLSWYHDTCAASVVRGVACWACCWLSGLSPPMLALRCARLIVCQSLAMSKLQW